MFENIIMFFVDSLFFLIRMLLILENQLVHLIMQYKIIHAFWFVHDCSLKTNNIVIIVRLYSWYFYEKFKKVLDFFSEVRYKVNIDINLPGRLPFRAFSISLYIYIYHNTYIIF